MKEFGVTELTLGLRGEIIERGKSVQIFARTPTHAAEIYMERLHHDDCYWEAVSVEIEGRVFDCQVEVTTHYCAYERKAP